MIRVSDVGVGGMTLDDLPPLDLTESGNRRGRRRSAAEPEGRSRRDFLRGALAFGTGVGLYTLGVFPKARPAAAEYFNDWQQNWTGPCGSGGYAVNHSEDYLKCGPSSTCNTQCCSPNAWHSYWEDGVLPEYYYRPDECWKHNGTWWYDAWWWKYRDGKTYRCSDGWTCGANSCYKSICPWHVA